MKKNLYLLVLAVFSLWKADSQTPFDAIMMERSQLCVAVLYTHDTWDEYWEGTLKRENGNIGTLTRQTLMPMAAMGISDRLNLLAALPWVRTEASAGQMVGVQGFQDFGLWLKGEALRLEGAKGTFTLHTVLGLTGPASDYLPDYMPFSLGLGCFDGSIRPILQYESHNGFYFRGHGGYHLRSNCTIERDYYYTTHGVYSEKVDMPNALTYGAAAGGWLLKRSLRLEATFDGLETLGGHDIRRQDMPFPSNRMNFRRIGAFGQYYFPFAPNLALIASGSYVLDGRNVGQSLMLTGGVNYVIDFRNQKAN